MKEEFKAGQPANPDVEVAEEVLGDETSGYVPAIRRNMSLEGGPVNISMSGISMPWLAIAHGVGKLAKAGFNPGDLVLSGEHLLASKGAPINIVVVQFEQYWKQYLSQDMFNQGLRPMVFKTEAEAQAAGLRTQWENNVGPEVSPAMDWFMLIEKPKDIMCALFGAEIDGVEYAPALMSIDKQAYKAVAGTFLTAAKFSLSKRGIYSAKWELKTKLTVSKTGNSTWVPTVKLIAYNPESFVTKLKALFSSEPAAATSEPAK